MLKLLLFLIVFVIFYNCFSKTENFNNTKNQKIVHLFWTGGYDSTFRLCQALLDEKKIVQPYYLIGKVDNCKKCKFERQNKEKELETMNKIVQHLNKNYPNYSKNLRKIIFIKHVKPNQKITETFWKLRLHNYNRKYNQYEAMCRYSTSINKKMEIGTVGIYGSGDGILPTDRWGTYLRQNLVNNGGHYSVNDKNSPIYNLRFPLAFISKSDMLIIAKRNNYGNVIKLTWSCWFPKNGKPCNKCIMCTDRVIPQI